MKLLCLVLALAAFATAQRLRVPSLIPRPDGIRLRRVGTADLGVFPLGSGFLCGTWLLRPFTEWDSFKKQHGKVYATPEMENTRFAIFNANKFLEEEHNAAYRRGDRKFRMKLGQFGDQASPEFVEKVNGYLSWKIVFCCACDAKNTIPKMVKFCEHP